MSNYILTADGHLYHYASTDGELYHYGVAGMKWGRRKARPVTAGTGRRGGQANEQDRKANEQDRKARTKKAMKIGAAAVGTALAAYGAYRLAAYAGRSRLANGKKVTGILRAASDFRYGDPHRLKYNSAYAAAFANRKFKG